MSILNLVFLLLLIISIFELYFLGSWNKFYFFHGIPIFIKKIDFLQAKNLQEKIITFIETIENEDGLKNMKGKIVNKSSYCFREKLIDFSFFKFEYTPVMHGNITIDITNRVIVIKGLLNIYFIIFCILWLLISSEFSFQEFKNQQLLFKYIIYFAPILVFCVCYLMQYLKYRKIEKHIKQIISENT